MEKTWSLQELYETSCSEIPTAAGVYFVVVPEGMQIVFEPAASNRSAPFYAVSKLQKKYAACKDKQTVYIGKATGKNGLRQRILQYVKFGWNEAVNHKGGRAIWQIKNAGNLRLYYTVCDNADIKEYHLLCDFKEQNGTLPLANWRK